MTDTTRTRMAALCLAIALFTGATAFCGVFMRGTGASVPAVSVRGEHYDVAVDGVYRFNAQRVVAEGVGWDIFTLFVAVPAMIVLLPALARGRLRARLLAVGLLSYFFYQYLMYAMTWAFGPLFLPFVAIYAGSLAAIAWIVSTIDIGGLAEACTAGFPRRGMAVLSGIMAGVLTLMWMRRIAAGLSGDWSNGMLLGQTTMVVQALDLGLIVPLATFTAIAAWRGRAIGYLLSSVFVVKAVAMALAICAMLFSAWRVEGRLEWVPLAFFGGAAAAAIGLGTNMYRHIDA